VLPAITTGAGQRISFVLLNDSNSEMTGTVEIDGQLTTYAIPPNGAFVRELSDDVRPLATGFGVVRANDGSAPSAYAIVTTERRDRSLESAHIVSSHQEGTLLWGFVNTTASLLRHGDIDVELSLVNEGPVPATVYLELFDVDGNSSGRAEQIVPLGRRDQLSLEDVFGRSPIKGTLRIFADSDVAATLQRKVETIIGDTVLSDIPLQANPENSVESTTIPTFVDGSGFSTEILMMNIGRTARAGALSVRGETGDLQTIILR